MKYLVATYGILLFIEHQETKKTKTNKQKKIEENNLKLTLKRQEDGVINTIIFCTYCYI